MPSTRESARLTGDAERHPSLPGRCQIPLLRQEAQYLLDTGVQRLLIGADDQLRLQRLLVGGGDAGELRDLTGAGLLVEALRVATLALLQRARDVDFHEIAGLHEAADGVAVGAV